MTTNWEKYETWITELLEEDGLGWLLTQPGQKCTQEEMTRARHRILQIIDALDTPRLLTDTALRNILFWNTYATFLECHNDVRDFLYHRENPPSFGVDWYSDRHPPSKKARYDSPDTYSDQGTNSSNYSTQSNLYNGYDTEHSSLDDCDNPLGSDTYSY